MDETRGQLTIYTHIFYRDFSGKDRVKTVTVATENDVTRQQAKGYTADWRGMNKGDYSVMWKPYAVHL